VHTNSVIYKGDNTSVMDRDMYDGHTNKNSTFLATSAAGEIRAPPDFTW